MNPQLSRKSLAPLFLLASSFASAAYLSPKEIDLDALLLAPPKAESAEQKQDLAEVQSWQSKRSRAECQRADRVAHVTLATGFGPPDGPLTSEQVKRWDSLFSIVHDEAEVFIKAGKNHWKRPRPFLTDTAIRTCVEREGGSKPTFSYPSGHATLSRLFARVLSELDPSRKERFLARGNEIAADRVRAGVHYPKDIEAGKKLGEALFQALMQKPDFRKKLEEARKSDR